MNWTLVVVYAHWVGAIILVGYCLFWAVMTAATRRELSGAEADDLLRRARGARWPMPTLQPSISVIGWLLLAFVGGSGVLAIAVDTPAREVLAALGASGPLITKSILYVALLFVFAWLGRSRAAVAFASLAVALAIVAASVHLVR